MAELFEYLDEPIDISGDLIPCEFCGDLFPISIFIEHSTGCQAGLFAGVPEPYSTPEFDPELEARVQTPPKPSTSTLERDEKVFPKTNYSSSIKIEQLVSNEVYDIKPKNGGGSVLKKLPNLESKNNNNNDAPNAYIHFKTDILEQGESDSDDDDDDEQSKVGPEQAKSFSSKNTSNTHGLDAEDSIELSDDNNEENETVESFLLRASLQLSKIKQLNERAKAKWKEPKYSSYDSEEEPCQQYTNRNIYCQDCY